MTIEAGELRAGAPGPDETPLLAPAPSPERAAGAAPGDLAARVRVLRRARRDAETRAARVRRVLLAPTMPAAGGTPVRAPKPHRH